MADPQVVPEERPTEGAPPIETEAAPVEHEAVEETAAPETEAEEEEAPAKTTKYERPKWLEREEEEAGPEKPAPAAIAKPAAEPSPMAQEIGNLQRFIGQYEANPPVWNQGLYDQDGQKYADWFNTEQNKYTYAKNRVTELTRQQRLDQLEAKFAAGPELHPLMVKPHVDAMRRGIDATLQTASKDPAYSDPKVREPFEKYLKETHDAARRELRRGVTATADTLSDGNLMRATLYYYKLQAGYQDGKAPESVATPATIPEAPRSTPSRAGLPKMDPDEADAYKAAKAMGEGKKFLDELKKQRDWDERSG